jgi:hypothetical protein
MDEILLSICSHYHINLVTGLGFMSITRVIELLQRVCEIGKLTRILYISDYDPAGTKMLFQVARQIEFWLGDYCPDGDIKLEPIVLTQEQVIQYRLPRISIKDTDKQKETFEERYGEGAMHSVIALHLSMPSMLGII